MIDLETALDQVLLGASAETIDARALRSLVAEVEELRCQNLPGKLREFKDARSTGRLGVLMGELLLVRAMSLQLGSAVEFWIGDETDIRKVNCRLSLAMGL